ncbi:MAG: 6-phosphogluconolactonase [Rhodospirillales bacterium]|nr:6-phosphogluconolactonase [Rhodospirillales bacterium]
MAQPHQNIRWRRYTDSERLERTAVDLIKDAAQAALAQRGAFHIVLAGGRTPKRVYAALRSFDTDWSRWHVYYGDERCLPVDHEERNNRMAEEAWLHHVPIPAAQVHPIPAERGAEAAARAYAYTLAPAGEFDLVLLGLGEDGHTASLFPGQVWGQDDDAPDALAVHNAPKPPSDRVSVSAHRLSRARQVVFLVCGSSKTAALSAWREGKPLPAAAITPKTGVDVLVDFEI